MKPIKPGITTDKLYRILNKIVKEWGRDSDVGADVWDWMVAYLDTEHPDKPVNTKAIQNLNDMLTNYDLFEGKNMKKPLSTEQKLRKIIRKEVKILKEGSSELKQRQRGLYDEFNEVMDAYLEWCSTSSAEVEMDDDDFYNITVKAEKMLKALVAELNKIH